MPKISIIIPACNEEKYLKKTLDAVFSSSFKDFEVIVILDACTDNTLDVVKKYKNIKFLSIQARRASIARNKGASIAQGKILIFLDADTIIPQDLLEIINKDFTSQYSSATVKAVPDINTFLPNLILLAKELYITSGLRKTSNGIIITHKEIFEKIKGFREDLPFHEDGYFIRAAAKLNPFQYIKKTIVTESMRRYQKLGYIKPVLFWFVEFWKNLFGKRSKVYPVVR
tara:strand:- start:10408 stop:11091 length:684 start_codon:yes stop_codon:yes gene_type:complete